MSINLSILGSTGSIGTQTLNLVDQFKNSFNVAGLAAGGNLKLLQKQIKKYRPEAVSVKREEDARLLEKSYFGDEGNCLVATLPKVDKVVVATHGLAGIKPTLAAIKSKKTVALATKEVLVAAGGIVTSEVAQYKVKTLSFDSDF